MLRLSQTNNGLNNFSWMVFAPGGPYWFGSPTLSVDGSGGGGAVRFSIGFLIVTAISFAVEIAYAFAFSFILVKLFAVSLDAVKAVFPAAQVGLVIVMSAGMVAGALRRGVPFALIIGLVRIITIYAQFVSAIVGIYLFEKYLLNSDGAFALEIWLPPFMELGQINLSEALFGLLLAKFAGMLPPIFGPKQAP